MTTVVTVYEPTTEVTVTETAVTANITEQTTAVTIVSGVRTLANLSDVALSSPADTQVLTYDTASGKWINAAASGGVTDVSDLTATGATDGSFYSVLNEELVERTPGQVLSDIGAETAGAAAAVQSNLGDHEGDSNNPHNVTAGQVGALQNIVEDTTPQLGGNLDLNSFVITGLEIGTDVQAHDDNLDDIAGLAPGAGEDGYSITWDNGTSAFILSLITGGGGSQIVDTKANILAMSPDDPAVAFATDNNRVYLWDGSDWYESPIGWTVETAVPDMGAEQDSGATGYGSDYITDKRLSNVLIGSNARTEEGGARLSESEIEFYLSGVWKRAVTGFSFREDNYVLEYQPTGLVGWYEVATGNSDALDARSLPLVRQYSANMGAYSTPLTIDGGSF